MTKKTHFTSKVGLIAATVGSAVGLGNVWRFPAEVQANGGAAFLIIYALCVLILGIPVMVSEFSLGRAGQSDAIGAFRKTGNGHGWWIVGAWSILASYLILCFYMVVAGWTFEYLWQSITGTLFDSIPSAECDLSTQFAAKMDSMTAHSYNPLIYTYIMIILNLAILMAGVQKGIERISSIMMPVLFIILIIFIGFSLSLPKASDGVEYFLNPDFSKITPGVVVNALGQAFFSLSLGMGILITYSSYFPPQTRLMRTAITVSVLDMTVAVMMGLIIFPAVMSFDLSGESLRGATLVFITLPEVFAQMPGSQIWATLFFLLLTLAALTSTISIAEVSVSFVSHSFKVTRRTSCLIVLLPLFILSALCALSFGPLSHITVSGFNIFEILDNMATDIMLPVSSIGLCVFMGWFAPQEMLHSQLTNHGTLHTRLYAPIVFIIRYIAPLLIALVLTSYFL